MSPRRGGGSCYVTEVRGHVMSPRRGGGGGHAMSLR